VHRDARKCQPRPSARRTPSGAPKTPHQSACTTRQAGDHHPDDRALRADARRNREQILRAARDTFAPEGSGAASDEIARRAGVGVGTIYRHFVTKEGLLQAVVLGRLAQLADEARRLSRDPDPGRAFFTFAEHMVDETKSKRDLAEALTGARAAPTVAATPIARELRVALASLLRRAQGVDAVRTDVNTDDVLALLAGVSLTISHHNVTDAGVLRRTLSVVCDGLRPQGCHPPTTVTDRDPGRPRRSEASARVTGS
jgi:AcrR family transcriptional regulator